MNSEEPWTCDIVLCGDLTYGGVLQMRFREPMHTDVDRDKPIELPCVLVAGSRALWLATVRVRVA